GRGGAASCGGRPAAAGRGGGGGAFPGDPPPAAALPAAAPPSDCRRRVKAPTACASVMSADKAVPAPGAAAPFVAGSMNTSFRLDVLLRGSDAAAWHGEARASRLWSAQPSKLSDQSST